MSGPVTTWEKRVAATDWPAVTTELDELAGGDEGVANRAALGITQAGSCSGNGRGERTR